MIRLIHGNCLDILPTLPSESVDLVLTDPPYGIAYRPMRTAGKPGQCAADQECKKGHASHVDLAGASRSGGILANRQQAEPHSGTPKNPAGKKQD